MQTLHEDNSRLQHFAKRDPNAQAFSTMPVPPFVYQFFLYNSIYQVDWRASTNQRYIRYHPIGMKEGTQQGRLEDFLCHEDPSANAFISSFNALRNIDMSGAWTVVAPDNRITSQMGNVFFEGLEELQESVRHGRVTNVSRPYHMVGECRYFIYQVRNNIFHGRKTLLDMDKLDMDTDDQQRQRIDVYYLFLNCLMRWFFEVAGNTKRRNSPHRNR